MSGSPFLNRLNKRDSGHHGRVAEKKLAKRVGGREQPGSGALAGAKGDVKVEAKIDLLLENKSTNGASFTMRQDWLHKVYQEALEQTRAPALSFQFTNDAGVSEKKDRWVCVPEHIFQELMEDEKC